MKIILIAHDTKYTVSNELCVMFPTGRVIITNGACALRTIPLDDGDEVGQRRLGGTMVTRWDDGD